MKTDSSVKSIEFPMVLLRLADWLLYQFLAYSCYKAAMKVKSHGFFIKNKFLRTQSSSSSQQLAHNYHPSVTKCSLQDRKSQTLVCDIDGSLLRTESFFAYFMLVAFEGGSIMRAFLLLLSSPFLLILGHELKMRVMIFITFCGLGLKDMESVSRAVLPKFYLESMNPRAYDVLSSVGSKVVFTSVPRVMVERFLKDYLEVDSVLGSELHSLGRFYTGLVSGSGLLVKHRALKEYFGEKRPDIGLGSTSLHDHLLISQCKESYVITREDHKSSIMPRNKYPKPLIFHDGRLAFLPTPFATLAMFVWLPFGLSLAIFRVFIGTCLPRPLKFFLGVASGIKLRVDGEVESIISRRREHALYVCTHRTLLDPIFLSTCLGKPLTAVTYSLSRVSEMMAPIKTVRLTRDRNRDAETMQRLLGKGDLVVCPEGTTCREPYLLRFSSLFAELTDEIVPVAVDAHVTMFYGTTARGLKCFDPIFFFMNPRPSYTVHLLEKVSKEMTCGGGGKSCHEVANCIQKQLAEALGFECTNLTRKDKYLMLAGNDGVVRDKKRK